MCNLTEKVLGDIENLLQSCCDDRGGCSSCSLQRFCVKWYDSVVESVYSHYLNTSNKTPPSALFRKLHSEWMFLTMAARDGDRDRRYILRATPSESLPAIPIARR